MKTAPSPSGTVIHLAIDREHGVLVNPLRAYETDDFSDITNASYYDLEDTIITQKPVEDAIGCLVAAIERAGGTPPDWLEATPEDEAAWRATASHWLSSKVREEELMSLVENTPLPPYRDGVELRDALAAAKINVEGLRETCLRGGPGSSLFVTAFKGDPVNFNEALERAGLTYRVDDLPSDHSAIIRA